MSEFDVVVIGGGPGGYVCAAECAKLGKKTALIEKSDLGGTCLNRGCIPTKSLLHAAELYSEISRGEEFGVQAENIFIDFAKLKDKKNDVIVTLRSGVEAMLKAAKVSVIKGEGFVLESGKVLVKALDGSEATISCNDIVVATGSVPARPPIPGLELPGVMTSDDILENVPALKSIVIIGGGVIGLEFATLYSELGAKVTVIEGLPKILATMDKDISQSLTVQMKKHGLEIVTDALVGKVEQADDGLRCIYAVKGEVKEAVGEAVLVAVGRRVELNKVFAEGFMPECERGRAVVNEQMLSSIPHVYVIGDAAAGYPQLAHAASAQGVVAACAIAGAVSKINLNLVPGCVYTSPEIASVGLTEAEAKEQGISIHVGKVPTTANGKSILTNQERGFVKVLADDSGKIVGAQLFSARATDMVGEFALAINSGMNEVDALSIIRPHPTFEEMLGEALAVCVQKGAKKKK
ncbi:MAG: dihydrolipoyl dehydrogenase [Phascolarctobacterium sp.]|nr:dihydrolipoyl dehydrogenase [Phascolarctobacterium sp.]